MPINPMYVQPLSFQQANPVLMGAQVGSDLVGNAFQNQLRNLQAQAMAMQNQVLPQTLQGQLQRLQLGNQAQGIQNQYLPQTLQSDIGVKNAQAGLMGTEEAKNQFQLNNPWTMIGGIPAQIAAIDYLQQHYPRIFGITPNNTGTQVTNGASTTGQTLPPSPATQGGLAAVNAPNATLPQPNVPIMMQGVPGGGQYTAPASSPAQSPSQGTQMFGGNPLANQLMSMITAPMMKNQSQIQYYLANSSAYSHLTPDAKNQVLGQATSFGYTPDQAANLLMSGKSLPDLAVAKGYDADPSTWPDPQYAPTGAMRSLINRRQSSLQELNTLGPQLTQALAPYSQRIAGYSPAQIADAISNDNPDQQARFLAAKALMPEYSALRLKVMSGQVGIEAIKEVQNASMGNIKAFQSLVKPEVYTQANQYMDQWLNQATNAANRVSSTGKMPDAQTLTNSLSGSNAVGIAGQGGAPATITANLGGKTYVKINGSWYQQ